MIAKVYIQANDMHCLCSETVSFVVTNIPRGWGHDVELSIDLAEYSITTLDPNARAAYDPRLKDQPMHLLVTKRVPG
jgi:hypothetical protein